MRAKYTCRTRLEGRATNFRCLSRVIGVSRDACISPALIFLADIRDYSQSNGEHARGKSRETNVTNHSTTPSLHLAHFGNFQSSVFTIIDENVSDTFLREPCIDKVPIDFCINNPVQLHYIPFPSLTPSLQCWCTNTVLHCQKSKIGIEGLGI